MRDKILLGVCLLLAVALRLEGQAVWPERYAASVGFDAVRDHDSKIIVLRIDSLSEAYRKGIRPGMEIIGWNTLPIERYLNTIRTRKMERYFPGFKKDELRIHLLTRGQPGEAAQVFFMTGTGNNWGLRLTMRE